MFGMMSWHPCLWLPHLAGYRLQGIQSLLPLLTLHVGMAMASWAGPSSVGQPASTQGLRRSRPAAHHLGAGVPPRALRVDFFGPKVRPSLETGGLPAAQAGPLFAAALPSDRRPVPRAPQTHLHKILH